MELDLRLRERLIQASGLELLPGHAGLCRLKAALGCTLLQEKAVPSLVTRGLDTAPSPAASNAYVSRAAKEAGEQLQGRGRGCALMAVLEQEAAEQHRQRLEQQLSTRSARLARFHEGLPSLSLFAPSA
jgi:hypothetical protein